MTGLRISRLLGLAYLALPILGHAHGGGLDASGCHTNRKTGDYHCHRSSYIPSATNAGRVVPPTRSQAYSPAAPTYSMADDTCHTGPRGGRYRIVNGKKRYGC